LRRGISVYLEKKQVKEKQKVNVSAKLDKLHHFAKHIAKHIGKESCL